MLYTAPDALPKEFDRYSIFIAGGISNCPDWQQDIVKLFDCDQYDIVNPRRAIGFDTTGAIAEEQITWEFTALNQVDACVFWFPEETLCPITLYELGKCLVKAQHKQLKLIIGWHPNYKRAFDLIVQIKLEQLSPRNLLHSGPGWQEFITAINTAWN